jgi:hypothetical protein
MNMGTQKADVTYFSAGDEVPEWLLSQDPTSQKSKRGDLTFGVDVIVLHARDKYYIIPQGDLTQHILAIHHAKNVRIAAAGLPTVMVTRAVQLNLSGGVTVSAEAFNRFASGGMGNE